MDKLTFVKQEIAASKRAEHRTLFCRVSLLPISPVPLAQVNIQTRCQRMQRIIVLGMRDYCAGTTIVFS